MLCHPSYHELSKQVAQIYLQNNQESINNSGNYSDLTDDKIDSLTFWLQDFDVTNIKTIIIPEANITDRAIDHLCRLKWLERLDISSGKSITNESVKAIGQNLLQLKVLDLTFNMEITNIDPLGGLKELEILEISYTSVKHLNIEWVRKSKLIRVNLESTLVEDNEQKKINELLEKKRGLKKYN